MLKYVRLILSGLSIIWDHFWTIWMINFLWILLCLPVVSAPAATAGMYFTLKQLAYEEDVNWKTLFSGIKPFALAGYRWAIFNLVVIFALAFYIWYFSSHEGFVQSLLGLPVGLLVVWLFLQTFTFPLLMEQKKPSYLGALRNSLVVLLKWPGFSFVLIAFNIAIISLSIWLQFLLLILTAPLTAFMACYFVKAKLEEVKEEESRAGG